MTASRRNQMQLIALLVAGVWVIMAAFPFLWTLWGSFKVQADFFSARDWTNALTGPRTIAETGGAFTGAGLLRRLGDGRFLARGAEHGHRRGLHRCPVADLRHAWGLCAGAVGVPLRFIILMVALIFRAMPHITLVSGYLLPFFQWNLWGHLPTAIIVLVAINQPFTLWMLHSFFLNIPKDLDESAMVDGCTGRRRSGWSSCPSCGPA